jgi:CRP-like cAMP-binding protein
MEKYYEILLTNPIFAGISREELHSMLQCLNARATAVPKGSPVFLEGDPAGFIGIVLEGAVRIVRDDYYGQRTLLAQAEPGDIFAETYACAGVDAMPVSGYAALDSRVLLLQSRKMLTVCTNACGFHNRLVKNLLQVVSQKNLLLSSKIQFMSRKTTKEKLMAYLLDQAKRWGSPEFTIPLDRQALADFLGVERSAMSAELSKLRRDGLLESTGSRFRLLKEE